MRRSSLTLARAHPTLAFLLPFAADQPYDAKYILFVYGPKVYNHFIALATKLTSVTYQSPYDKESDERSHVLFLLLMIVLLFSDGFEAGFNPCAHDHVTSQQALEAEPHQSRLNPSLSHTSESTASSPSSIASLASPPSPSLAMRLNEKLNRIQQSYVELACRYLYDAFGLTVGRRMFQDLVPLLFGECSAGENSRPTGERFPCRSAETVLDARECESL